MRAGVVQLEKVLGRPHCGLSVFKEGYEKDGDRLFRYSVMI